MSISQMPCKAHQLIGFFVPHFDDILSSGPDHEQPPVRKLHGISFGHGNRFPKSEKDLLALIRSHANAAAVAPVKIESERACRFFLRPASGESVN
jgi:hypothetical protein